MIPDRDETPIHRPTHWFLSRPLVLGVINADEPFHRIMCVLWNEAGDTYRQYVKIVLDTTNITRSGRKAVITRSGRKAVKYIFTTFLDRP